MSYIDHIEFESNENKNIRTHEVVTLSNGEETIAVWPNDLVKLTLWDDSVESGHVCWSIDPGCISVKMPNSREVATVPPLYIKKIEILEFSELRDNKKNSSPFVMRSCITEFNEELHIANEKRLAFEEKFEEGRKEEIFLSVQEGDYTIERGAQKLNITVEEFEKRMKDAGYKNI